MCVVQPLEREGERTGRPLRKRGEWFFGVTLFGEGWLRAPGKATPHGIALDYEK
jgi:hypothetical protein